MLQRLRNRITPSEREGGFTLIELLVVMIIIAVLLAIAIPSYLGFKDRAQKRAAESNVRESVPTAEAFYSDANTYVGLDNAALKAIDSGVSATLTVPTATLTTYCLEDTVGSHTASFTGPGGTIVDVAC